MPSLEKCMKCGERRLVATDSRCQSGLCLSCCSRFPPVEGCSSSSHRVARRALSLDRRSRSSVSGRGSLPADAPSDDDESDKTSPPHALRRVGSSAASSSARRSADPPPPPIDDVDDMHVDKDAAPKDLLARAGPLASYVLSDAERLERVLRAWRDERWCDEDRPRVLDAFRVLSTEVFSPEADISFQNIVAKGSSSVSGPGAFDRTYAYGAGVDDLPRFSRLSLGMSLRAAIRWGSSLLTIFEAEERVLQNISKRSTAFLDLPAKTSSGLAALAELRDMQPSEVAAASDLPSGTRLADPFDLIVLGLHLATITPDRLRSFLLSWRRELVAKWTKRNSKSLISSSVWDSRYRKTASAAIGSSSFSQSAGQSRSAKRRARQKRSRPDGRPSSAASGVPQTSRPAVSSASSSTAAAGAASVHAPVRPSRPSANPAGT